MHRNRTWSLDLPEWRTQRNRVLAAEGGDGSTLSLDFTAGTLDSRFQCTRVSNATFINSEGYVQYADANLVTNSIFSGAGTGNLPTNWTGSTGVSLTIPSEGVRRAVTTTAAQNWAQSSNLTSLQIGLTYQTTFLITEVSGQHYANTVSVTNSATAVGYYRNGVNVGQFATAETGLITIVWIATATTHGIRAGIGSTGANVANAACTFSQPITTLHNIHYATAPSPVPTTIVVNPYIASTVSNAYFGPRFDFNPTTRQVNGLLIEPTNTNKAVSSETLSGFSSQFTIFPAPISTSVVNPAGVANTIKMAASTSTALDYHARALAYVTPANTQEELTFSVWLKSNGYTKAVIADGNSGRFSASFDLANGIAVMNTDATGGTGSPPAPNRRCRMTAYRDGWWRCEVTVVAPSNPTGLVFSFGFMGYPDTGATLSAYGVQYVGTNNENDGIYAYGPQLEIGPIATSYIPTGTAAGGATRNADNVVSTDVNWFTSSNAFTFLADFIPLTPVSGSIFPQIFSLYDTTAGSTLTYGCAFYYYSVVIANLHTMSLQTKITSTSNTDSTVATAQTYGQRHKLAYAVNGTTSHIRSFDGSSVTNSPAAPVAALASGLSDTLYLGSAASTSHMTGWLRGIKYWPSTKPIEELNRLTDLSAPSPTFEYDFTVGSIPATMAYTIGSNATFINSSGIVEWGNANMYWNTAFEGLSGLNPVLGAGTGWTYGIFSSGSAVFNGDGTVTITTTTADRRAIFRSSGFAGGGLRVIASVDIIITSGELPAFQLMATGTPTNSQYYVNGIIWNNLHPLWSGGNLPVGIQFNLSYATDSLISGTTSIYFGIGCSSIGFAGTATFSNPRWTMWKGSGTVPYYPNTSATNSSALNYFKTNDYYAPRFDYNPQTSPPEALGILNEAATTNLLRWSESFRDTGAAVNWAYNGNAGSLVDITNPANGPQSFLFREPAGTGTAGGLLQSVTTLPTASAYTFSVWVRGSTFNSVTTTQVNIGIFTGGSFVNATTAVVHGQGSASGVSIGTVSGLSTTTWTRVRITTTANINASTAVDVYIWPQSTSFDANASILLWGAQLEPHSGVSSYIPTGASQGTRNATSLIVNDITPFNYNREGGTMYVEHRVSKAPPSNTYTMRVGFTSSTNLPVFEMFPSGLNWFTALRGDSLEGGGANERSIAYALNTNYKYAVAFNTRYNPILSLYQNTTFSTANAGNKSSGPSRLPNRFTFQRMDGNIQEAAGTIKSVKYWPIVLTAQQLKTLTQ